jgi:hypothetical protein
VSVDRGSYTIGAQIQTTKLDPQTGRVVPIVRVYFTDSVSGQSGFVEVPEQDYPGLAIQMVSQRIEGIRQVAAAPRS